MRGTGRTRIGVRVIPEIEQRDLGGDWVEGIFLINEVSAYLALQTGLPQETIKARIIQAYGYCQRPPKDGEKIIYLQDNLDLGRVDHAAILAMRRVIDDFLTVAEIRALKIAYLAADHGDAWRAAYDLQTHPYIVIAALDNLKERGELPEHPSMS